MPQQIRLWEVTVEQTLASVSSNEINLEERLEDWLESDISVLDENLLVIGRQVRTDYGGEIDLLCLDAEGNCVVIELKKGKTPRDVTAQALDYASWVKELTVAQITEIADRYFNSSDSLPNAFAEQFEGELPDALNQSHRSLIVAAAMDDSTERIVRYLADLAVPINVATVQHFRANDGKEILAQVYLVDPGEAEVKGRSTSRIRTLPTIGEMETIANERGVSDLYDLVCRGVAPFLRPAILRRYTRGFRAQFDNGSAAVVVVDLHESNATDGLKFRLVGTRMMRHFGMTAEQLASLLPNDISEMTPTEIVGVNEEERNNWIGYKGFFHNGHEINTFIQGLRNNAP